MPSRYDASTRAKAIRLVREHAEDYPTEWAAITAVAGRLGMSAETLRKWVRQAEVDAGEKPGRPPRSRPRSVSSGERTANSSKLLFSEFGHLVL
jgi:transposase-like protein